MRDFSEPLHITRETYSPIEQYEQLLNYISQRHGIPISPRVKEEYRVICALESKYSSVITNLTEIISEGAVEVKASARKYNVMHFQNEYMDVPKELVLKGKSISSSAEVQQNIDKNCPNFINSLYMLWSDLNSRKRISNVVESLKYVEGEFDSEDNPLHVVRPRFVINDETTSRISTQDPGMQSFANMYKKEYIISERGRKLVGADISAQEAMIFFNGICHDPRVLEMYEEYQDIYLPVVAIIENTTPDKVDASLRKSYKTGIMTKMNNGGVSMMGMKMQSYQLANKLENYIQSNSSYQQFMEKARRANMMSQPYMESFIQGRGRTITNKSSTDNVLNKLVNTPLQTTAIAFMAISIFNMMNAMMEDLGHWNSLEEFLEDIRPIYHGHDEILLSVADKNNYPELSAKYLEWALGIKYENWTKFRATPYIDTKYQH